MKPLFPLQAKIFVWLEKFVLEFILVLVVTATELLSEIVLLLGGIIVKSLMIFPIS